MQILRWKLEKTWRKFSLEGRVREDKWEHLDCQIFITNCLFASGSFSSDGIWNKMCFIAFLCPIVYLNIYFFTSPGSSPWVLPLDMLKLNKNCSSCAFPKRWFLRVRICMGVWEYEGIDMHTWTSVSRVKCFWMWPCISFSSACYAAQVVWNTCAEVLFPLPQL